MTTTTCPGCGTPVATAELEPDANPDDELGDDVGRDDDGAAAVPDVVDVEVEGAWELLQPATPNTTKRPTASATTRMGQAWRADACRADVAGPLSRGIPVQMVRLSGRLAGVPGPRGEEEHLAGRVLEVHAADPPLGNIDQIDGQ
jgi:hypothetical protein